MNPFASSEDQNETSDSTVGGTDLLSQLLSQKQAKSMSQIEKAYEASAADDEPEPSQED